MEGDQEEEADETETPNGGRNCFTKFCESLSLLHSHSKAEVCDVRPMDKLRRSKAPMSACRGARKLMLPPTSKGGQGRVAVHVAVLVAVTSK